MVSEGEKDVEEETGMEIEQILKENGVGYQDDAELAPSLEDEDPSG